MNYKQLFDDMFPGFFQNAGIAEMPEDWMFSELVMDLRNTRPAETSFAYPDGVSFCQYHGRFDMLQDAVRDVEDDWVQFFHESTPVFCALDRDRIVSFCILSDWGLHHGLRIGGPGCVGTVPAYRQRGIGLEMVRRATNLLEAKGFDLSWIHHTHLDGWYQKLGYQTVLKWNSKGIIDSKT